MATTSWRTPAHRRCAAHLTRLGSYSVVGMIVISAASLTPLTTHATAVPAVDEPVAEAPVDDVVVAIEHVEASAPAPPASGHDTAATDTTATDTPATDPATTDPAATDQSATDTVEASVPAPPTSNAYVPSTTIGERSLDVSAFSPICIANFPYIQFAIKPIGFTSSGPATLTFFDSNGNFVEQITVPGLSGTVIYPGASVNPPGWPGWQLSPTGKWVPDPSDAILRRGLTIKVEVNPTATASVSYVPTGSSCADPPGGTPPSTTTPAACVPGQTVGSSDPNCALPRTGNDGIRTMLTLAGIALASGIGVAMIARRRGSHSPPR